MIEFEWENPKMIYLKKLQLNRLANLFYFVLFILKFGF